MGYPNDPKLKGLAAVVYRSDIPPWEFDIRAVPPGTEPLEISDWHRRHGRANRKDGNIERAAEALIEPVDDREDRDLER